MPAITLSRSFKKRFKKKTPDQQESIQKCLRRLGENPRHRSLNSHKMKGTKGVWEAYVDRGNRVTFHYDEDGGIVMRNHCNHDMLTKNP